MVRVPEYTAPTMASLSPRKVQILKIASRGLTNVRTAQRLTVTTYLPSVYRKLGVCESNKPPSST